MKRNDVAKQVSAVILAGGNSQRMGTNKALLEWQGKSFLEHIQHTLAKRFKTIYLSGPKDWYAKAGYNCIEDAYGQIGPLGALASVFDSVDTDWVFVVSCDTPAIQTDVLDLLLAEALCGDNQVVVCEVNDRLMPLVGMYHKSVLVLIKKQLEAKQYRMMSFLEQIDCKQIVLNSKMKKQLTNVNTPEDFEFLLA